MYHVTIFEWNNITLNTSRFIKPRCLAISTYVPAAKKGTRLIMSTRFLQVLGGKKGYEINHVYGFMSKQRAALSLGRFMEAKNMQVK
jgi:hypothetical protein